MDLHFDPQRFSPQVSIARQSVWYIFRLSFQYIQSSHCFEKLLLYFANENVTSNLTTRFKRPNPDRSSKMPSPVVFWRSGRAASEEVSESLLDVEGCQWIVAPNGFSEGRKFCARNFKSISSLVFLKRA
jgi:hypothetical protein